MGDSERKRKISPEEREVVQSIKESGALNFESMGRVVAEHAPKLLDSETAADDYLIKVVESVLHLVKLRPELTGIEEIASLREMRKEIQGPQ